MKISDSQTSKEIVKPVEQNAALSWPTNDFAPLFRERVPASFYSWVDASSCVRLREVMEFTTELHFMSLRTR